MLQISQRPLSGSDHLDGRLFVDRTTELAATARALDLGFNVLVLGEPKSGRTSFLRRAQRRCADSGRSTVLVDAGAHAAPGDLVAALRRAIAGTASGPAPQAGRGTEITEADVEAMASGSDAATVVFVDDPTPATANLLFGRFRYVMWQFPHLWVVSGNLARRSEYLRPPADAFFDAVVELGPLDEANARALLLKRIETGGDSDDARKLAGALERIVERVTERTPGGPARRRSHDAARRTGGGRRIRAPGGATTARRSPGPSPLHAPGRARVPGPRSRGGRPAPSSPRLHEASYRSAPEGARGRGRSRVTKRGQTHDVQPGNSKRGDRPDRREEQAVSAELLRFLRAANAFDAGRSARRTQPSPRRATRVTTSSRPQASTQQ